MDEHYLYDDIVQMDTYGNQQEYYRPPQIPFIDMNIVREQNQLKDRYGDYKSDSPVQKYITTESERRAFKSQFAKKPPAFQPIDMMDLGINKNETKSDLEFDVAKNIYNGALNDPNTNLGPF